VLDLVAPIGMGQRGVIVAPPRRKNHFPSENGERHFHQLSRCGLDHSPHRRTAEEVTDMQRSVKAK